MGFFPVNVPKLIIKQAVGTVSFTCGSSCSACNRAYDGVTGSLISVPWVVGASGRRISGHSGTPGKGASRTTVAGARARGEIAVRDREIAREIAGRGAAPAPVALGLRGAATGVALLARPCPRFLCRLAATRRLPAPALCRKRCRLPAGCNKRTWR